MSRHIHSHRTKNRTTRSPQKSTTHLMARKPTRRATDERGPKTPITFRTSRARSIPLLMLGSATAVV
jgi:hypothetical protein